MNNAVVVVVLLLAAVAAIIVVVVTEEIAQLKESNDLPFAQVPVLSVKLSAT